MCHMRIYRLALVLWEEALAQSGNLADCHQGAENSPVSLLLQCPEASLSGGSVGGGAKEGGGER